MWACPERSLTFFPSLRQRDCLCETILALFDCIFSTPCGTSNQAAYRAQQEASSANFQELMIQTVCYRHRDYNGYNPPPLQGVEENGDPEQVRCPIAASV